jgi:hypothetical protein
MTFDSLIPNTSYTFTLYEFRANYTDQRIVFTGGPFPELVANTASDEVTFLDIVSTDVVKTLSGHRGFVYPLTIRDFDFTHAGTKSYNLNITFTSPGENTANIWDLANGWQDRVASVTVPNIQNGDITINKAMFNSSGFYLDYFQSYDITITVWNTTDNVPVRRRVGGIAISVYCPLVVETRLAITYPSISSNYTKTSEIITIYLSDYPDLQSTDKIDYYANVGYLAGTGATLYETYTGNVSSVTFIGLIPNTSYLFTMYEFRANYEAQRIIVPPVTNPLPNLDTNTASDEVIFSGINSATIRKTLSDHLGFVYPLTIPGFKFTHVGTKSYNLMITFTGGTGGTVWDIEDTRLTEQAVLVVIDDIQDSHSNSPKDLIINQTLFKHSGYYLDYFQTYSINIQVFNTTDDKIILSGIDGPERFQDFFNVVVRNSEIKYPSINNNYTSNTDTITIYLSDYPDLQPNTAFEYYANVGYGLTGVTPGTYITPGQYITYTDNVSSMTFDSLIPFTDYTFILYEFRTNYSDSRLIFEPSLATALDANTASDNVSFSDISSATIRKTLSDHRGFVYPLTIPGFKFTHDGTKSYNLMITFTGGTVWDIRDARLTEQAVLVVMSNIQDTYSDSPKDLIINQTLFDDSKFYLDYFQTYSINIQVVNTTDDDIFVVSAVDRNPISVNFENVVVGNPLTSPSINNSYTGNTDTITITLSNYPDLGTDVDNYYANVGYGTVYKTRTGNVSSMTFDSLIPNTSYTFTLYEFRGNYSDQRIVFTGGPFSELVANTASDNVSSLNSGYLTRTLKNDNAHTGTITIPNFTFNRTGSKDYAANVTVYKTDSSVVSSFDIPGMDGFTGNIPNNSALDALNFFTAYMLRFEYFNLTDSVTVYTDNTQSVRANNDYSLTAQSPLTCPVSFGTFTTNTTSIVLSRLGFNSTVYSRLNVTINDSYTFSLQANSATGTSPVPVLFNNSTIVDIEGKVNIPFSSLEPNINYTIELINFVQNPQFCKINCTKLQYTDFPTSVSLLTGKFSAPTIRDPVSISSSSDTVHVGFTPPEVDELQGYLTNKGLVKAQFKATFSVESVEHNQANIEKNLDYSTVVTGASTVPINRLLPNTQYKITLTGFEYITPGTIPFDVFSESSVNALYTSTDNVNLTMYTVTRSLVDDDGAGNLTFTGFGATRNGGYTYSAEIYVNDIIIQEISGITTSSSNFTLGPSLDFNYYQIINIKIKIKNTSFNNDPSSHPYRHPYVKTDDRREDRVFPDVNGETLTAGAVPTITVNIASVLLSTDNENIVITMASTANTLLPDVGTFKPNDLYRFKYTVSYE